jgi:hypothetical protein
MGGGEAPQGDRAELQTSLQAVRTEIAGLQRLVDAAVRPGDVADQIRTLKRLHVREKELADRLLKPPEREKEPGLLASVKTSAGMRGLDTTGLEVKVFLHMTEAPTSIYHLLDGERFPLVEVTLQAAAGDRTRRVRVRTFVQGYTAEAVSTREIPPERPAKPSVRHLPTFFPSSIEKITELTRATLNVVVDDLDSDRIEMHETRPLWLLARNSAPIRLKHPTESRFEDMRPYLGAFVTPHQQDVMEYLNKVAGHHEEGRLDGYYATERGGTVESQVRAIYAALQDDTHLKYVSSFLDFNPNSESASQRVRLPRESLRTAQANCLDGAVLFASLLEAISIQPAIVYVPGHAMVAWRDGDSSWKVLDTTKLDTVDFDAAIEWGSQMQGENEDSSEYAFLKLAELRRERGITPLE